MALNAEQAITAGRLGAEIVGLTALVAAVEPAITNGWQVSGVTIQFANQPAIQGAVLMTTGGSAATLSAMVAALNAEIAAATETLAGM